MMNWDFISTLVTWFMSMMDTNLPCLNDVIRLRSLYSSRGEEMTR